MHTLSGTLYRPYSNTVLANTRVIFTAATTAGDVIERVGAEVTTDSEGAYSIDVRPGIYNVALHIGGRHVIVGRHVVIDDDTLATDLLTLLRASANAAAATGDTIAEFRALAANVVELHDETRQLRDEAASKRDAVAADRIATSQQRQLAETAAGTAADAAGATAADRQQTGEDRAAATDAAGRAETAAEQLEQLIIENKALRALVAIEHGRPLLRNGERF